MMMMILNDKDEFSTIIVNSFVKIKKDETNSANGTYMANSANGKSTFGCGKDTSKCLLFVA